MLQDARSNGAALAAWAVDRYKDGFPIGEPKIVFKFRHPDMQRPTSGLIFLATTESSSSVRPCR